MQCSQDASVIYNRAYKTALAIKKEKEENAKILWLIQAFLGPETSLLSGLVYRRPQHTPAKKKQLTNVCAKVQTRQF